MARPTKAQVEARSVEAEARQLQAEAHQLKMKRYKRQESKRADLVQIDQNVVLYSLIGISAVVFVTSGVISFNGMTSVAEFVGSLPGWEWIRYMFFGGVEVAIIGFLGLYLLAGSREDADPKSVKLNFGVMVGLSMIAVFANMFHTFDFWKWNWVEPRMYAGVVLSTVIPLSFIFISKQLSDVVFAKAISLAK
jgi:hypothetical protein